MWHILSLARGLGVGELLGLTSRSAGLLLTDARLGCSYILRCRAIVPALGRDIGLARLPYHLLGTRVGSRCATNDKVLGGRQL